MVMDPASRTDDSTAGLLFKTSRRQIVKQTPLSTEDYIQHLHVAFHDFTTQMTDQGINHDAPLSDKEKLDGYNPSPAEAALFEPTALRQLSHFYANYALGLVFRSHPTFDFQTNRQDAIKLPTKEHDLTPRLGHDLQSFYKSLDIFESKLTDDNAILQLSEFRNKVSTLTDNYCGNKSELMFLRNANKQPVLQDPQPGIKAPPMHLN